MTQHKNNRWLVLFQNGMLTITTSGVLYICKFLIELKEFKAEINTKMTAATYYIDEDAKKENQQDQRITYLEAILPNEIKMKKNANNFFDR